MSMNRVISKSWSLHQSTVTEAFSVAILSWRWWQTKSHSWRLRGNIGAAPHVSVRRCCGLSCRGSETVSELELLFKKNGPKPEHWAATGWTGLSLLELKRFNQMLKLRSTDCLMAKSPTAVTVKFTAQIHAPHRIWKICWPINNYFLFKWPHYSNMTLMNLSQRISLVTIIFSILDLRLVLSITHFSKVPFTASGL